MLKKTIERLYEKLTKWIYIHLVISIYSFLILVCWGIPFCPMSFVGNLIFGPVLTLFLGLSTLLFFTELCFIPNGYIALLLDIISHSWLWTLNYYSLQHLQIPCARPSIMVMSTLFCAAFIVILLRASYIKKNVYLCLMLISSFWLAGQHPITDEIEHLPCANGNLHIVKTADHLIVVDPGCLGRYISAPSFVQFTLMPHLVQKYGTYTIDHLILLQPGKLTFDAVQAIVQKGSIKHLYIPLWQGQLSKSGLISFMRMKEQAEQQSTVIHRLNNHEITLIKNKRTNLSIKPVQEEIKKTSINFKAFCVGNTIDKQSVTFYPSKYSGNRN